MTMTITCSRHPGSYTCNDGHGNGSHSSSNNSSYPSGRDRGHDIGRNGNGRSHGQVYEVSSQSNAFYSPELMVVPSTRRAMVEGEAYRNHMMDLPGQVKALAQVIDCPTISRGAIHFAQLQSQYKFNDRPIVVSDLTYLIHKKAHAGWGHEVFSNIKDLNLHNANSNLSDFAFLFAALHHQQFDLNTINLSKNRLDDAVGADLFRWLRNDEKISAHTHIVKYIGLYNNNIGNYGADMIATHLSSSNFNSLMVLDLHNNQIGDQGAERLAASLTTGAIPHLNSLDLHGNHITPTGYGHFAKALQNSTVQNMIIHLGSITGDKIAQRHLIEQTLKVAENNGIDINAVAVNKSFLDTAYKQLKLTGKIGWGWAKCYFVGDDVKEFVADKVMVKTAHPLLTKLVHKLDVVTCYLRAWDENHSTPEGVEILKYELEALGTNEMLQGF